MTFRAKAATRRYPSPSGHADLTGMRKYGFDDARPVLERSARETASRVALGEVAKQSSLSRRWACVLPPSHVLSIGGAGITDPQNAVLPKPEDLEALDASPVRTLDKTAEQQMIARIDEAKENADTLGGVIEVVVYGVPAGIGTYVESDRRLDAALASAVMGVQAIKGVEIRDGFLEASAQGEDAVEILQHVKHNVAFQLTELRFAVPFEIFGNLHSRVMFDLVVGVGERQLHHLRHFLADAGLARAHHADDDGDGSTHSSHRIGHLMCSGQDAT